MAKLIEGDWVGEENPERTTRLMDTPGGLASGRLPKGTGYKARLKKRLMKGPGNLSAGKDPRRSRLAAKGKKVREARELPEFAFAGRRQPKTMEYRRAFEKERALQKKAKIRGLKDPQAPKRSKASPSPSNS
jgi:hypothetical protein